MICTILIRIFKIFSKVPISVNLEELISTMFAMLVYVPVSAVNAVSVHSVEYENI